ncbi:hypothetical protein GCM10010532_037660 [Dactylosporangium siamense]|uniref:Uncharacterized protein n=1 Tax=Dactylosporangium siamense TaxID=685454 RepID=A0A919UBT4_9ACTN|nr:hypothetical protein Dsi01nite_030090 [Dactylosporangium siamense]
MWNRQPGRYTPPHPPGPFKAQPWAGTDQWVISRQLAHPALVSVVDFIDAQHITALPAPRDAGARDYRLEGPLHCRSCRHRHDSCWSHGRPAHHCRQGCAKVVNPLEPILPARPPCGTMSAGGN